MGIPGGGTKGLKAKDDAAITSPPPPGPRGTLLDGTGCPGVKVFPRVDPQLLESAEETNVGLRDGFLLASLDFHVLKMLSFRHIISTSVALKSSRESKQRDSLCMLYTMSHSRLRVKGLPLMYSHTVGQPGCRARSMRSWDMVVGLSLHNSYIAVGILVTDLVRTSLAGGPLLDGGPHEVMHN